MVGRFQIGVSSNRVGKFLVARPNIQQGFFSKSVVYIYEDGPQGTAGVALNEPTPITLRHMAAQVGVNCGYDDIKVFRGGPVNENAVSLVHTPDFQSQNTFHTQAALDISSDTEMIHRLASGEQPAYFRLTTGASVWAPGQLDSEFKRGFWLLGDLELDQVLTMSGDAQWYRAIELIGNKMFAKFI